MAAIYSNFQQGTLSANITNVATTITSSGFSTLPVVASPDTMWLVLDPNSSAGAPEIVQVTTHTSGSTSVTVTRAQQSTTARSHNSGMTWCVGWTKSDADFMLSLPRGTMAYASRTTSQLNITTVTDLTGLSVTWTAISGRRYRVTFKGEITGTVTNDLLVVYLTDGSNAQVARAVVHNPTITNAGYMNVVLPHIEPTTLSGSITRKVRIERNQGTGNFSLNATADNIAYLLVEDIGT